MGFDADRVSAAALEIGRRSRDLHDGGGRWRRTIPRLTGALLLTASAVALLFFDFGTRVLATNDETRFPMLARNILRSGQWIVLSLGDRPHLNKPPLFAWLIALVAWPTGSVTQSNALWPSLLSALGVMAVTAWIGTRLWNRTTGLAAGFIVVTMHGVFTMARAPMPDVPLCLALTAAMATFFAAELDGRRRLLIAFYALVAVGFWMKGPAALLGVVIVVTFEAWTAGWAGVRRLHLLRGLLLIAAFITPWLVLSVSAGRERFRDDILMTDWLLWYLPFQHVGWRTITEPIAQTLAILLPWSLVLPFAVLSGLRRNDRTEARKDALLIVWAGVVFVLVGLSEQQRMRYYLPLCPPMALMIAVWYSRLASRSRAALGLVTAAVVVVGIVAWQRHDDARQNALTDLRVLASQTVRRDRPLYAHDVPELVLAFYLDRRVVPVRGPDAPDFRTQNLQRGYLAVADRARARWLTHCPAETLGAGLVNGRPFSVLQFESAGCRG